MSTTTRDIGTTSPSGLAAGRYTATSRALHWLTAILVLGMIPAGLIMTSLPSGALQNTIYSAHKVTGIALLVIIAARIAWRATHPVPPLEPVAGPRIAGVARANHLILYILLSVQVLSGYVLTKAGGYPIPILDSVLPPLVPKNEALGNAASTVHWVNQLLLIGFISLHVAGALYHIMVRKDGVIRRIWPIGAVRG